MAFLDADDTVFGSIGRTGERVKLIDVEIILGAQPVGGAKSASFNVDFKTSYDHQGGSHMVDMNGIKHVEAREDLDEPDLGINARRALNR